jgi:pyridoxine 5-phosphate synthase
MIELHTGTFANAEGAARTAEVARLRAAAELGNSLGLQINAGHGLNTRNLPDLFSVPHMVELNIGHSIVSQAIFLGMEAAVREMLTAMEGYQA